MYPSGITITSEMHKKLRLKEIFRQLVIQGGLIEGGEEFGKIEVDGGIFDGETRGVDEAQTIAGVDEGGALDGVDDPEVEDAHVEVVIEYADGAGEAVFWGENLDAEDGRSDANFFEGAFVGDDADVGNAYAGRGYAGAQLRDDTDIPLGAVSEEPGANCDLQGAVLELAEVAFLKNAVYEVTVGVVCGVEILF